MARIFALFGVLALSAAAGAHHSPNVHFDRGDVVEIAGTLTEIEWRNPHTLLVVETVGDDGSTVVWLGETRASTQLARAGLGPDIFHVGDTLRVAGFRARRNPYAMFVTNVLLTDGRELVAERRWSNFELRTHGDGSCDLCRAGRSRQDLDLGARRGDQTVQLRMEAGRSLG